MIFVMIYEGNIWHIVPPHQWRSWRTMCGGFTEKHGYHTRSMHLPEGANVCKACLRETQKMLNELRPQLEAARERVTG